MSKSQASFYILHGRYKINRPLSYFDNRIRLREKNY